MDGVGGVAGWRWIFILEGIATVLVAVAAHFLIQDYPDTAKFLTEEERTFVIHRLRHQYSTDGGAQYSGNEKFKWKYVRDALLDWQVWGAIIGRWLAISGRVHYSELTRTPSNMSLILVWYGIVCPMYGVSYFLPTIIRDLGYTSSIAQLLTVRLTYPLARIDSCAENVY